MNGKSNKSLGGAAAVAGAAIGSAALAAALLYVKRRRERDAETRYLPTHPEQAPETD